MQERLAADICTVLSLMPGFPAWTGETGEALDERYFTALVPVPDAVGERIRAEVDRHFRERPAVKALLEWAATLTPVKTFDLADVGVPRQKAMPAPGADPSFRGPPPEARAIIQALKRRDAPAGKAPPDPAEAGDWGLEWDYGGGVVRRMPARWSEAKANALAEEYAGKFAHLTCRAYQAGPVGNVGEASDDFLAAPRVGFDGSLRSAGAVAGGPEGAAKKSLTETARR